MSYDFVLQTPQKKVFPAKRIVEYDVQRPVKKKGKDRRQIPVTELPESQRPTLTDDEKKEGKVLPLFVDVEVDVEYDDFEIVKARREEPILVEKDANVVRMADAHNDKAHARMFTHYVVGRYEDEKFTVPERSDGLVFGGSEYVKRGYEQMEELDEKKLLMDVVGYFGWKGDLLEAPDDLDLSDDFRDSGEES